MHSTVTRMLWTLRGRCTTVAGARAFLQSVGTTTVLRCRYFLEPVSCTFFVLTVTFSFILSAGQGDSGETVLQADKTGFV